MSSTYSAESADCPSVLSGQECTPRPSANASHTHAPCSPDIGQQSHVTTTFAPSPQTDWLAMELLESTSSLAASPARTSALLEVALALLESDQGCGASLRGSLASYDQDSSSWKTSQHCLSGELETYSETFPESGMTRSGQLYPRAPWVRHMCDDECSLWPTPTASMGGRGFGIPLHERGGRYKASTVSRVRELVGEHGWRIHPNFTEALMGFPTEWTAIEGSEMPSSLRSQKR